MNRGGIRAWCGLVLLLCAGVASAAELVTPDGVRQIAWPTLDNGTLVAGDVRVPLDRLVLLRRLETDAPERFGPALWLADGSRLPSDDAVMRGDRVRATVDGAAVEISAAAVDRLLLLSLSPRLAFADVPTGARLLNGEHLAGGVLFLDAKQIAVRAGARVQPAPRDSVALVRFSAAADAGPRLVIERDDGVRLAGTVVRWEAGQVSVRGAAGEQRVPTERIVAVWHRGALIPRGTQDVAAGTARFPDGVVLTPDAPLTLSARGPLSALAASDALGAVLEVERDGKRQALTLTAAPQPWRAAPGAVTLRARPVRADGRGGTVVLGALVEVAP